MHDRVITELGLPSRYVDAVHRSPDEAPAWLSCPALREEEKDPDVVLDRLLGEPPTIRSDPFRGERSARAAFYGHLYATRPPELGSAKLGGGWGIGAICDGGAALVRAADLIMYGTGRAGDVLYAWLDAWEAAGRPGLADLRARLRTTPDGWEARPVFSAV